MQLPSYKKMLIVIGSVWPWGAVIGDLVDTHVAAEYEAAVDHHGPLEAVPGRRRGIHVRRGSMDVQCERV